MVVHYQEGTLIEIGGTFSEYRTGWLAGLIENNRPFSDKKVTDSSTGLVVQTPRDFGDGLARAAMDDRPFGLFIPLPVFPKGSELFERLQDVVTVVEWFEHYLRRKGTPYRLTAVLNEAREAPITVFDGVGGALL